MRARRERKVKIHGCRLIGMLLLSVVVALGCAQSGVRRSKGVPPRVRDAGEVSLGAGTGIESQDLVQVTDKMARKLLDTPEIVQATESPIIALLPVENDTRFPINKKIFTRRIKALLNERCERKVMFVARDRMDAVNREREMKDKGIVTSQGEKDLPGADYFLTGELTGLSQVGSTGQSDYVLYTFRLIDAESSIELWEGMHEIKKEGLEDVIYR